MERSRKIRRRAGRRGNAVIEFSFLVPWLLLLFASVFDFGFYAYALITTQNAARVAALHTSSQRDLAASDTAACRFALSEMKGLPNARNLNPPCPTTASGLSDSTPVAANADQVTGADGFPASRVTVMYRTVPVFPLPWMGGQMTMTRVVEIRIKEE